ncbi:hypothetical protein [Pedobacter sandarakinus]|uniref:hypothetical protein n=1 Tax=Pedobacter sandarakinus TaxID=353156 RepID=UPI0022478E95|nr:hypothetical protein [Pedobacter sandarakinus]
MRLQRLDRINTISFGRAVFNHLGVSFAGDGGGFVQTLSHKLSQLLVEITDNKKNHSN